MTTIHEIDKEHNGYVTRNELEDILKMYMKETLNQYNISPILMKFSSIQNKILIDYNKFHKWILKDGRDYMSNMKKKTQMALGILVNNTGVNLNDIIPSKKDRPLELRTKQPSK